MRRRRTHNWYLLLGVFAMMFVFGFLINHHSSEDKVKAASLDGFDPGFIISDWQMSNYNSMSEADIQSFLTSKNSCNNRDYDYYLRLSANKNYTWHWADDHFVCLSEELFGDGEVIGSGETAAHILWQTAQDYKINPQALLVLLQKETGLITDPIPNNGDYRKATGYGCPDTAPCSSQYYGFKNQVRRAAALYRTVLDGGWTNYPLGENYVQYNPNPDCGGSVVNIRSLATSALYRYTPYQPNAGALAAGYGTAYCGAYGNRNFYLYFQDWFGGITDEFDGKAEIERYVLVNKSRLGNALSDTVCGLKNEGCYKAFEGGYVYWTINSGAHLISGVIFDRWFTKGTEWGILGYPVQEQEIIAGINMRQKFERGFIYYSEKTGAWDISGGILSTWEQCGSHNCILGYPTSSELKNSNNNVYQLFENGSIYWDVSTGGWIIRDYSIKKWETLGGFKSKLGKVVNNGVCGLVKGGCYQAFRTGNIYWTENTGAYDVSGGIYEAYLRNGTEWGPLGYPTSSEQRDEKGAIFQKFENGVIYWNVNTGAWLVRNFSLDKWRTLGGFKSKLGKVVNNGVCGLVKGGCYQAFRTGNIYWTENTGAYDVSGGIYEAYLRNGTEWGPLGYPTSSEQRDEKGAIFQKFENGVIYWDVNTGARVVIAD